MSAPSGRTRKAAMFPRELPYLAPLKIVLGLGVVGLPLRWSGSASPYVVTIGVVVLAALIALALLYIFVVVIYTQVSSRWGAVHTLPARVERKWTNETDLDLPQDSLGTQVALATDRDPGIPLLQRHDFWVSFDLGGDRREEFRVAESLYVALEEEMTGLLTFRGERLLRFVPESHPEESAPDDGPSQWRPGRRLPRTR
jgi:hypothetical protein